MKILFIGSRLFDDVDWYLKSEGITSIITESNENAANLDLADKKYIVPRGMDEPMKIAIDEDVDAVIPLIGIDPPLIDVGALKDKLEKDYNIPVIAASEMTSTIAADKYDTKQLLDKNNIKTPKYEKIEDKTNRENIYNNLPLVIKTPAGQGGCGVKIALNSSDCDEFIDANIDSDIFTEEYVEGYEASIEVLRYNNQTVPLVPVYKGVTTLKGVHPLAKIKQAPLNIAGIDNEKHNKKLQNLAVKLAEMVDLSGTMDIDILHDVNSENDYIIELNTRPSGTRYMTAASTNIYPLCQLVDMAKGQWDACDVKKSMKNYYAAELPVGVVDDNKNPNIKYFKDENCYVVHGPANYQRVTLRAQSKSKLTDLAYDVAYDYANENDLDFKDEY